MSVVLGPSGNPLIAYIDHATYSVRVFACADVACNSGTAGGALAAFGFVPGPRELTIYTRPCGNGFPLISYTSSSPCVSRAIDSSLFLDSSGALGVIECSDAACTTGINHILVNSGVGYASMVIPPIGHPYEGVPMIAYSYNNGSAYDLSFLACLDGTCASCQADAPSSADPVVTVRNHSLYCLLTCK